MIELMKNNMGGRMPLRGLQHRGGAYPSMDPLKKNRLVHPLEFEMLVRVRIMKLHSTIISWMRASPYMESYPRKSKRTPKRKHALIILWHNNGPHRGLI